MEISEIERLAEMVQQHNISELTLKQGEARITLRKPAPDFTSVEDAETSEDTGADDGTAQDDMPPTMTDLITITAPLVGVFHHVKPVVGLATRVTSGQVIGVIEAMRLVNEVTSPTDGVVTDAVIEEGAAVEYGQPLFVLEPE